MSRQSELRSRKCVQLRCIAFWAVLCALTGAISLAGLRAIAAQEALPALESGKVLERRLASGETHTYQIPLLPGQYLRVSADQRGIDLILRISDSNGQKLVEMDSLNGTQGLEIASAIANQAGEYRLEIISPNKEAQPGRYEVKIETIRPANEQDRKWFDAQRAYAEGRRLRSQSQADAQRLAIERFDEALQQWQELGDRLMAAHTLYYLASSSRRLGRQQQSLQHYGQALQLVRGLGEQREEATVLTNLGIVYHELGEPRKAIEHYEQSLPRWREIKDSYNIARTRSNMGAAYRLLGDPREALDLYAQALPVWRQLGYRLQEADTCNGIGGTYGLLGEWQKALEHHNQALSVYRALGNRASEAEVLHNIGAVYGKLGEAGKELEYYGRALAVWRSIGNRREEANTLTNVGSAEAQLNNAQKALGHYNQALQLWRETGDRRGEAITLRKIGDLHASSPDPRKALGYYDQALPLSRSAGDRWSEAGVLRSLGLLHISLRDSSAAAEHLNQALMLFRSVGDRSGEAQTLEGIARVERDRGNLSEARKQIEAALSLVEAVRMDVGSQQLRASYLASVQKYYELNIDLLMRLHRTHPAEGFDALAVEASERARARGLLELLTEAGAGLREGADPALLERERALAGQLNAKARSQMELLSRPHKPEQEEELKREITELETEYEQVQTDIRRRSPHYAALTQPRPLTLAGIQQQLDGETLLVEYALGEERSYCWAITRDVIASHELPPREQIEKSAKQVYELLTSRGRIRRGETSVLRRERIAREEAQLPEAARQLSQMLLAPIAASLGNKRLVVVADGVLQYLPFAMLPVLEGGRQGDKGTGGQGDKGTRGQGNPQSSILNPQSSMPLIVNHEIISLPSASTLAVQRRELADRKSAPKLLAIIADPVFAASDERNRAGKAKSSNALSAARSVEHEEESAAVTVGRFSIPRLPFTRQEAARILALAPGSSNLKALDFRASRATATDAELGQYRYLHFATHGLLDSERPGLSSLVLSLVDEQGKPQDGFLRAHEIYNLHLPADLVTLSACQTGLGKDVRGEGLVGLTRGFMYAGAARVVVSLWSVNDRATAELMARFYQKMLKDGQRPAAALRAAQVELWRQKQWQAPFYWAAFVLQGEWK